MSKTKNYRDIKNFMHNELSLDKEIVHQLAEKFVEDKLELIIGRKLDEMMKGIEFERLVRKIIENKIGLQIEKKVSDSIRWGGLKVSVAMLPEKNK